MRCMWSTVILLLSIPLACTLADDWPQWLGPGSASEWREEGIKTSFDDGQLQAKWTADCSYGYAGPAVGEPPMGMAVEPPPVGPRTTAPSTVVRATTRAWPPPRFALR